MLLSFHLPKGPADSPVFAHAIILIDLAAPLIYVTIVYIYILKMEGLKNYMYMYVQKSRLQIAYPLCALHFSLPKLQRNEG